MNDQNGPARWDSELGQGISDDVIAALRAEPRFSDACRAGVTRALAYVKTDPEQHASFRDIGRMVLGTLALYLHASGGLTHRRLCEVSSGGGTLSSGRASAILLRLRMIGYLKAAAKRSNGSARLYIPTPKMISAFRQRIQIDIGAIALLDPRLEKFAVQLEDDKVFFRLYRIIGENLLHAERQRRPDMMDFEAIMTRDAGMLIFYAMFEAADDGHEFPVAGPAKISLAALARRFGVSRTHVLRLMRDTEKMGFVERDANGDYGIITPLLRDTFKTYYSIILIALSAMCRQVAEDLKNEDAAGTPPLSLSA